MDMRSLGIGSSRNPQGCF